MVFRKGDIGPLAGSHLRGLPKAAYRLVKLNNNEVAFVRVTDGNSKLLARQGRPVTVPIIGLFNSNAGEEVRIRLKETEIGGLIDIRNEEIADARRPRKDRGTEGQEAVIQLGKMIRASGLDRDEIVEIPQPADKPTSLPKPLEVSAEQIAAKRSKPDSDK